MLSSQVRLVLSVCQVKRTACETDAKPVYSANLLMVNGDGTTSGVYTSLQVVLGDVALVHGRSVVEVYAPFPVVDASNLRAGSAISNVQGFDS
jgi:hypothetical protein